jgi:hypothetical protein
MHYIFAISSLNPHNNPMEKESLNYGVATVLQIKNIKYKNLSTFFKVI